MGSEGEDSAVSRGAPPPRTREFQSVAIIGAGEMGAAISTVCALAGLEVVVRDLTREIVDGCLSRVRRNLDSLVDAGEVSAPEVTDVMARVRTTTDLKDAVAGIGLVIEAVPEELALKQQVFKEIEAVAREDAILASNASGLPTTQIAAACKRPERVVGIHFFNPPFIFRAVEAIRGEKTSDQTFRRAIAFIESIGSVPIRVFKDRPRFVINALQLIMLQEAATLIAEGVTTAEDIDKAAQWSFGPRMAAYGVLRGNELIRPGSPLRRGVLKGEGLTFDYSAYSPEGLFRRRDLAFIKMMRAAEEVRRECPIE